jgi:hypothetical protein
VEDCVAHGADNVELIRLLDPGGEEGDRLSGIRPPPPEVVEHGEPPQQGRIQFLVGIDRVVDADLPEVFAPVLLTVAGFTVAVAAPLAAGEPGAVVACRVACVLALFVLLLFELLQAANQAAAPATVAACRKRRRPYWR